MNSRQRLNLERHPYLEKPLGKLLDFNHRYENIINNVIFLKDILSD